MKVESIYGTAITFSSTEINFKTTLSSPLLLSCGKSHCLGLCTDLDCDCVLTSDRELH